MSTVIEMQSSIHRGTTYHFSPIYSNIHSLSLSRREVPTTDFRYVSGPPRAAVATVHGVGNGRAKSDSGCGRIGSGGRGDNTESCGSNPSSGTCVSVMTPNILPHLLIV